MLRFHHIIEPGHCIFEVSKMKMEIVSKVNSTKVLKLNEDDNVLVALQPLSENEKLYFDGREITILHTLPAKHKVAIDDIPAGGYIKMYGLTVGKALSPIREGMPITTTNTIHESEPYKIRNVPVTWNAPDVTQWRDKTFQGYHRDDGQIGTRNYWIVFPLVFCENRNIEYIRNAFTKRLGYAEPDKYEYLVNRLVLNHQSGTNEKERINFQEVSVTSRVFPNVDGIKFLTHDGGCGGTGEDSWNLCRLLAGYLNNANVAGATVLSLGCQKAEEKLFREALNEYTGTKLKPVLFFEQQQYRSEEELLQDSICQTFEHLIQVNKIKRKPAPLNKLVVGLKCGGSDGFSGITANPAMGYVSDILAALGGKTILAEFPELCGAEQDMIDRCRNTLIAEKFLMLMTNYNNKAIASGSGFHMNPSPGNIKDGLITDAMKSAGAARKGGTSPVSDVLNYTEFVKESGLSLLCTPGNDVLATTGMAGSGATLIIFSTGLGTPTGNAITPVIKTSTNSNLPDRMRDIIDFDHGDIITEGKSIQDSGDELLALLIRIANGEKCCAEILHQEDFIPWKMGVSL